MRRGAIVSYSDPFVPTFKIDGHSFTAISTAEALAAKPDCVVITTDHDVFDYEELVTKASLIMDARNALKKFSRTHIHRL